MLLLVVVPAPIAAQTANESIQNSTELAYQFDNGGEVVDIDFADGDARIHIRAPDRPISFALAEGQIEETGGFSYQSVRLRPGEDRVVSLPVRSEAVVVTSGNDGYYHEGDIGLTVLTSTPTAELIQMGGISGITGTVLALGIVVGQLRRRHENSYKELFSEQRHKIETDPVTGYYEAVVDSIRRARGSKVAIGTVALVGFYAVGVLTGRVMGPGEAWLAMGDSQRIIVVGSIAATIVAIGPVYYIVKKIWNPNREFVLDLDSQDVYRAAGGDQSGGVAAYSAPPSRVADLEVDGSPTTIGTPGGRLTLVRGFDPEENTAEANPPEVADDRDAIIKASHIAANREIMEEMADVARSIIGYLPTLRVEADFNSAIAMDDGMGGILSAGGDTMERMMSKAAEGTDYEDEHKSKIDQKAEEFDDADGTDDDEDEGATPTPKP